MLWYFLVNAVIFFILYQFDLMTTEEEDNPYTIFEMNPEVYLVVLIMGLPILVIVAVIPSDWL